MYNGICMYIQRDLHVHTTGFACLLFAAKTLKASTTPRVLDKNEITAATPQVLECSYTLLFVQMRIYAQKLLLSLPVVIWLLQI